MDARRTSIQSYDTLYPLEIPIAGCNMMTTPVGDLFFDPRYAKTDIYVTDEYVT
jgi:hypothetical protein